MAPNPNSNLVAPRHAGVLFFFRYISVCHSPGPMPPAPATSPFSARASWGAPTGARRLHCAMGGSGQACLGHCGPGRRGARTDLGCLIPKPRGPQRRSRAPRGTAAPFPHLAARLLGGHVLCLVTGSPQICEPEAIATILDGPAEAIFVGAFFATSRSEQGRAP